jgi:hypothetical protein
MTKLNTIIFSVLLVIITNTANAAFVDPSSKSALQPGNISPNEEQKVADLLGIDVSKVTLLAKIDSVPDSVKVGDTFDTGGLEIEITELKDAMGEPLMGEPVAGKWTYTGTKSANYIVIKGSNNWQLLGYDIPDMGLWDMDDFPNQNALSNISAYHVVPVPAAVWLFGSALIGLVGLRRTQQAS